MKPTAWVICPSPPPPRRTIINPHTITSFTLALQAANRVKQRHLTAAFLQFRASLGLYLHPHERHGSSQYVVLRDSEVEAYVVPVVCLDVCAPTF